MLMLAVMRFSIFFPLSALLVACVNVEDVPGPDGETAHVIHCGETSGCYEKARDVCPDGYTLRSSGSHGANAVAAGNVAFAHSSTELVVSCDADIPSHASSPPPAAAQGVSSDREDARVCEAAYVHAGDFATYWASRSPGSKRLDELPERRDFVVTCRAMPEPIQRCMHDLYRQAHVQQCEAMLSRLDPSPRARIDGLFLVAQAPPSPPPESAPGQKL